MDSKALHEALAGNYMLVDFRVRAYGANKTDRGASEELIASKSATSDSGKFMKKLFASADAELKKVQSSANNMRLYVYAKTLPWASSSEGVRRGPRLLPTLQAMDFLQELNGRKVAHDKYVVDLQTVWDQRVAEAIQNLGGLANPSDYPAKDQVPSLFSINVDLRPVPSMADFSRLNVPAELVDALGARSKIMAEQQYAVAMGDLKDRMVKALERVRDQLGKHGAGEKTRLFETLGTNLRSVVDLARTMNMTNNPQLEHLAAQIEFKLLQHPIDAYKENLGAATEAAEAAKALAMDAMSEDLWN